MTETSAFESTMPVYLKKNWFDKNGYFIKNSNNKRSHDILQEFLSFPGKRSQRIYLRLLMRMMMMLIIIRPHHLNPSTACSTTCIEMENVRFLTS